MSGPWAEEWILLGHEGEEMDETSDALALRNPGGRPCQPFFKNHSSGEIYELVLDLGGGQSI